MYRTKLQIQVIRYKLPEIQDALEKGLRKRYLWEKLTEDSELECSFEYFSKTVEKLTKENQQPTTPPKKESTRKKPERKTFNYDPDQPESEVI